MKTTMVDKVYIFDMDGTLCDSQERVPDELADILQNFAYPIAVISGATKAQMEKQIPFPATLLPQNGNEYYGTSLSDEQKKRILAHIAALREMVTIDVSDEADLVQDRGFQISYSVLGHNERKEKKRAFDPDGGKRRALLARVPFDDSDVNVRVGGTTCFDYFRYTKGDAVRRFADGRRIVYFGDQLYDGGNDCDVIGIADEIHPVTSWRDTVKIVKTI